MLFFPKFVNCCKLFGTCQFTQVLAGKFAFT